LQEQNNYERTPIHMIDYDLLTVNTACSFYF